MASQNGLMGVGIPAEAALQLGYPALLSVTAAGTTTTNATVLLKAQRLLAMTASGADGVRLPANADLCVPYVIYASGGAGKVYPPTGASFNGDTADQSQTIAENLCAIFFRTGNLTWVSICGAVVPA